jgi:hypothetical protein
MPAECRRNKKAGDLATGEKGTKSVAGCFFTVRSDNMFPQSIGHFLQQAGAFLSFPRHHFPLRFFFLAASPPPDAGELLLPLASKKWPSSSTSLAALLMCLNRSPTKVVGPIQCSVCIRDVHNNSPPSRMPPNQRVTTTKTFLTSKI